MQSDKSAHNKPCTQDINIILAEVFAGQIFVKPVYYKCSGIKFCQRSKYSQFMYSYKIKFPLDGYSFWLYYPSGQC